MSFLEDCHQSTHLLSFIGMKLLITSRFNKFVVVSLSIIPLELDHHLQGYIIIKFTFLCLLFKKNNEVSRFSGSNFCFRSKNCSMNKLREEMRPFNSAVDVSEVCTVSSFLVTQKEMFFFLNDVGESCTGFMSYASPWACFPWLCRNDVTTNAFAILFEYKVVSLLAVTPATTLFFGRSTRYMFLSKVRLHREHNWHEATEAQKEIRLEDDRGWMES